MYVFFCKQKTAYEMRISDWSSDVCSSDFVHRHRQQPRRLARGGQRFDPAERADVRDAVVDRAQSVRQVEVGVAVGADEGGDDFRREPPRSEEHTSELQSLMRTSYAVFCLKKKKQTTQPDTK